MIDGLHGRTVRGIWLACLVALLLAACGGSKATPTPQAGNASPGIPVTATPAGSGNLDKVDKIFLQLIAVYQSKGLDAAKQFARDQGLVTKQDEVRITLVLDSEDPNVADGTALAIGRLGGRVTATMGNQLEFIVPAQTLVEYGKQTNRQNFFADLADFQHVRDIKRTPIATRSVIRRAATPSVPGGKSEGVALTGADKWQAAGITGKGVKVGVIDGAFNNYKQFLASAKVTVKSFRTDGQVEDPEDEEAIHGTACAEIVTEMAPDADIYLAAFNTPGEFVTAIRWLVGTVGVSVISTSIGFDGGFPLDGSGPLAVEIDRAKAAGVFFAISAGNEASGAFGSGSGEGHFTGVFADSDGDGFHDFPGAKQKNALQLKTLGDSFRIILNWDDWQRPHVNYDLFLYDMAGKEVGRSDENQSRGGKPPVEVIRGTVARGTYLLKIKKVNASDPNLPFNIYFGGSQMEQTTPASSLSTPADAKGAFTVAAIDVKTSKVEDFSSQGGTMDGRKKPEIGGPDRTASFAYASVGKKAFAGTSAATPHVAGAAALYKQAVPDTTPDATFRFFAERARKLQGSPAGDNISGVGLLFLDAVPGTASSRPASGSTPTSPPLPGTPMVAGVTFTDNFSSPGSGLPAPGYQNGEYRVHADLANLTPVTYPRFVERAASETYEVQARKTGGADDALMGIEVRRLDKDNYLLFVIANDGLYGAFARVNGSLRAVGPAGANPAIKANAANTLRVVVNGTKFSFMVNGQVLTQVDISDVWTQGAFGFVAGGGATAPADVAFTNYGVVLG